MVRQVTPVKYLLLVGGFAESKVLEHRIRTEFERDGCRVLVPQRPGLAVVKGAVMLGAGASARFASRVARRTYGVEVMPVYNACDPDHHGRDLATRPFRGLTTIFVMGKFCPVVRQGARVALGELHRGSPLQVAGGSDGAALVKTRIRFYASDRADAGWTTEEGVELLGAVDMLGKPNDVVRVDLSFGESELHASIFNETTGRVTPAAIQYDFGKLGSLVV